jgi:hypothetical protein
MALTKIFQLFALKCGSTVYSQITDATLNTNVADMTVTPSGHIIPVFTAHNGQRPEVPFTTHQIESALTQFGLLGGDPGVCKLILQKQANKANRVAHATAEHVVYTVNAALGYGMQISASNRQHATFQGRLVLLHDGTNAPWIYSGSSAITDTPTGSENFVLGPIGYNGNILEGTNDFQLAINPTVDEPEDDFRSDPVFASILNIRPMITFTTTDPGVWSLHESEIASADTLKVNLLRKKSNADRFADGDTEHINFAVTKGRVVCESIGGSRSSTRVRIVPVSSNGSLSPVIVTLDSAVDVS